MTFQWPFMLVALAAVPLLWLLYRAQRRRAGRMMGAYGSLGDGSRAPTECTAARRSAAWLLFLVGVALVAVALARPQAEMGVPRIEGTIIIAFDVSGSMAADDLKPTRMEAAKKAARAFVAAQPPGVRIGVVAFSDSGFAVQQPSYARDEILAAIDRLGPRRGTSLGNGILVSLDTIESEKAEATNYYSALTPAPTALPTKVPPGVYSSASIVMLSDGENTERPNPLEAAQAAADRGIRIYTIGLGSPQGADLKVEGFTVRTRLDEATLKELAEVTGGKYYSAPTESELDGIFEDLEPEFVVRQEMTELTAPIAGLGLALLMAGALVSLFSFGRIA